MLECGACQAANPAGTLFCVACGLPVAAPVAAAAAPVAARQVALVELENLVPTGRRFPLPDTGWEGTLYVGRTDLAGGTVVDLDLTAAGGRERKVSRRHAQLRYEAGLMRLADWESAHGTYLNKQRLAPGASEPLADGDEVRLAEMVFRVDIR